MISRRCRCRSPKEKLTSATFFFLASIRSPCASGRRKMVWKFSTWACRYHSIASRAFAPPRESNSPRRSPRLRLYRTTKVEAFRYRSASVNRPQQIREECETRFWRIRQWSPPEIGWVRSGMCSVRQFLSPSMAQKIIWSTIWVSAGRPQTTVYGGSLLKDKPLSPLWKMIRAENAASCAVELVYRARGHKEV